MSEQYPDPRGLRQPVKLYVPDYTQKKANIEPIFDKPTIDLLAGTSPFDPPAIYHDIFENPRKRRRLEAVGVGYAELDTKRAEGFIRDRFGLIKDNEKSNSIIVFNGSGSAGIIRQSLELLPQGSEQSFLIALGPCFPYILNCAVNKRDQKDSGTNENSIVRLSSDWDGSSDVISQKTNKTGMSVGTVNLPLGATLEQTMKHAIEIRRDSEFKGSLMFYLCNPGTPQGDIASKESIREFATFCAKNGDLLFIDEAYGDWDKDSNSAMDLTEELPNLIVSRTLSKAAKLAGWRVGYAAASKPVGTAYNATLDYDPYYMPRPQQMVANEILDPAVFLPYLEDVRAKTTRIKKRFLKEAEQLKNISILPSSDMSPHFTIVFKVGTDVVNQTFYPDLLRFGVEAAPGEGFQISHEGINNSCVRLMIPKAEARIPEIIRRLKSAVI